MKNLLAMYSEQLEQELCCFCKQLFKLEPETELVKIYKHANEKVFTDTPKKQYKAQSLMVNNALKLNRDIEALEYAWRFVQKENILTQKVQILIYLMETDPVNYTIFVNHSKKFFTAYATLAFYSIRSAFKLCKGLFILISLKVNGNRKCMM